jgi:membrane protein DedA with SNARE-associated domain
MHLRMFGKNYTADSFILKTGSYIVSCSLKAIWYFETPMEAIALWIAHYGYAAIFFLLVLGIVGLPVPDEWLLTFAGYLVYKGHLNLWPAFAVAACGSMCGITVSYSLGRSLGLFVVHRYGRLFRISQEDLDRVHVWFDRFGAWTLLVGYFVPGVRHFTAVVAGASKMQFRLFSIFAYAGALIWAATFMGLGYSFGEKWADVFKQVQKHLTISAWIAFALIVIFLIRWYAKRRTANGNP